MRLAAVLLAVAGLLVTAGVAMVSVPAGVVASGVLLAAWTVLVVVEVGEK